MTGVLDGVKVLDLSWGTAGPMAGMLLADQGAQVTKIEPPGGDPFRWFSGYHVWNRGKRSAVIDLKTEAGHDALLALAGDADILLESFSPGTTTRLGIDYETLHGLNPRLIYCSITGYGRDTPYADRPGYDALVTARTGLHWEQRGFPGGTPDRLSGHALRHPDLDIPPECVVGALREGPLFPAVPWPSVATCYVSTVAMSAALRAREITGRGQLLETSLMQGAMACCAMPWLRAENSDAPNYWTWVMDVRAPKGLFQCADGRWVLHWPMVPPFVLGSSEGDTLRIPDEATLAARNDPARIGTGEDDLVVLIYYYPLLAEAFRKFPSDQWVRIAAEADVALQVVRSPEEALADPLLLADGCVARVQDPDMGMLRQVGRVYELEGVETAPPGRLARMGEHTEEVLVEALRLTGAPRVASPTQKRPLQSPLDGIKVLDLGLALAGPFGAQVLADMGATVIKVNALHDGYWHSNHIAMGGNRGKRSIAVNLKDQRGLAVLHELVKTADVVHTNMRYEAAERLGVDYESLKKIKPDLIFCHTRGFEHGPRETLPGNDQTGGALAGVQWEDGGLSDDGRPIWSLTSLGDTGNGFLSAIAVIQAIYHRDRTGEGQKVDTSITYAHLFNVSYAYTREDGEPVDRFHLDGMQLGFTPRYRLYETSEGWLCVAAFADEHWDALCGAVGATEQGGIERSFRTRSARDWFEALDAVGVPCEVCSDTFALDMFDDPELIKRGWVTTYPHPAVGQLDMVGLTVDFSETPGKVQGPPVVVGKETRQIMREAGFTDAFIDDLVEQKVVLDTAT